MATQKNPISESVEVNANTFIGSQYAQSVSVTVDDLNITFEFIYINPRTKKGHVISRITMPNAAAKEITSLITTLSISHDKQKKGVKYD